MIASGTDAPIPTFRPRARTRSPAAAPGSSCRPGTIKQEKSLERRCRRRFHGRWRQRRVRRARLPAGAHVPASANPGHRVGRGVPDVAGNASPASGYVVRVDGQTFLIGGTSAVAPLWAGLIALINQKLGTPLGFVNPLLYGKHTAGQLFRHHRGRQRRLYRCRGLGCLHRPWPDHRHPVVRLAGQTMNVRPMDQPAGGTQRMGQRWGQRGRAAGRSLSPSTAVTTPSRSPGSWISPA